MKHITADKLQPAHLPNHPVCWPCVVQSISVINAIQLSCVKAAPIMSAHSPLSYSSFHLSVQQNSITLTLPYNHFSSLRLDSFPGQTEKSLITLWPWLTPFHLLWFPLSRRHPRWTSPPLHDSLSIALPPHLHFRTCEHLFKRDNPRATCPNLHLRCAAPDFLYSTRHTLSTPASHTPAFNFCLLFPSISYHRCSPSNLSLPWSLVVALYDLSLK